MTPIDYKDYPDNWKWLSRQVIKDANNKCELCYAPNRQWIIRRYNTADYPWVLFKGNEEVEGKPIKVVLTVHHIDLDKKNSKKQNLIALCQKCHLRLDLLHHMKNRKQKSLSKEKGFL